MNEQLTAVIFIGFDLGMAYLFALAPEEIIDFHVAIVVFRHLLAFAFANATRDSTPAYAYSLERR